MNINMPQVGDVWTNRTGTRHFIINNIVCKPECGNDYYNILCTEVGTGKIHKGEFSLCEERFHFRIKGVGLTNNTGNYYHSSYASHQMAGNLIPPGYYPSDVLTEAVREKIAEAEDKVNGGADIIPR